MAYKKLIKIEHGIYLTHDSRGRDRYLVQLKDKSNRWFPRRVFDSKKEARVYRNELLSKRDLDLDAPSSCIRNVTVKDLWEQWQVECRQNTSEGWRISQDQMARDHVLPYWGHYKVINITSRHVGVLMRVLMEEKLLGNQTRLHVYNLLNQVFKDAVSHFKIISESPVDVRFRPEVMVVERRFLKADDALRLLAHCKDHYLGPAIWLGVFTAVRPEALQALRWGSVDFESMQILIKEAYKRKLNRIDPFPKGKTWEYLPMPNILADFLSKLKEKRDAKSDDFVACGKRGDMLNYGILRKVLKRLCNEAGVLELTPHELRHSSTELYMRYGSANAEDVRRLLHHKSSACTSRYIHRTDEKLREAARTLGDKVKDRLVL